MHKSYWIFALLFSFLFFSCNSWINRTGVINLNYPELGSCGWVITMNNQEYWPVNLEEEYRVEGLIINLRFKKRTFTNICGGDRPDNLEIIEIIEIN